ncbi:hypothetical protein GCM10010916_03760 [Paenibacillus abyssi]|uniref:Uncharacterized protein n=1 Tax=Paenibacillus abyssi TaxID=1340531 RepID=A0A917FKS4_9BACL|nr:hypothetical protein GCM10010916_03760 [Paenibacillus abyssi]
MDEEIRDPYIGNRLPEQGLFFSFRIHEATSKNYLEEVVSPDPKSGYKCEA